MLDYGVCALFYRHWGESTNLPAGGDMITVVGKYSSNSDGA